MIESRIRTAQNLFFACLLINRNALMQVYHRAHQEKEEQKQQIDKKKKERERRTI